MIVVSPYTKKHYVSHTVMDYTAILKFIETRFSLAPLDKTRRRSKEYERILQFQLSAVDDASVAETANYVGALFISTRCPDSSTATGALL